MPSLTIKGVKLNFVRTGDGPDVVLIHGLASSLAFWYAGTILPLRRHFRLTAFDLRGHGYSSMPPAGYTHMEMAEDLAGLVDHLKLKSFHLVGHSYGGLISLSYCLAHPGRVRSLVLADVPLNEIGVNNGGAARWPGLARLQDCGIAIPRDDPYPELRVLEGLAQPHLRRRAGSALALGCRLPYGRGRAGERTADRWLRLLQTTTARDDIRLRPLAAVDLQQVEARTLAIYGGESHWRSSGEVLRSYLPRVEVVYVDQAGHAHPWERPGVFCHHVGRFLMESEQLYGMAAADRRQYERHPLQMAVLVRSPGGLYHPAATVNASLNGLLLRGTPKADPGSDIEVAAAIRQQGLIIPGKIVRVEQDEEDRTRQWGVELRWEGERPEAWMEMLGQPQDLLGPG